MNVFLFKNNKMQEHFSDIETSFFSSLRCKYDARTSADDNLRIGVPLHTSQTSMDIHLEYPWKKTTYILLIYIQFM